MSILFPPPPPVLLLVIFVTVNNLLQPVSCVIDFQHYLLTPSFIKRKSFSILFSSFPPPAMALLLSFLPFTLSRLPICILFCYHSQVFLASQKSNFCVIRRVQMLAQVMCLKYFHFFTEPNDINSAPVGGFLFLQFRNL